MNSSLFSCVYIRRRAIMLPFSSHFLVIFCGCAVTLSNAADPTVKLNSGYYMPIIGLGTNEIKPEDVDAAINTALDTGYRHIDTGYFYGNQDAIGKTLKKWFEKGNQRKDIYITAKLAPFATKGADVEKYLKTQLDRLQLDYVDMFLIHFPWSYKYTDPWRPWANDDTLADQDTTTDHLDIWKGMEAQVKAGKTKSIGFCTFNESQILRIINNAEIQPSNLQIELQAYNQQKPLRNLAAKHNIVVTGFSPLGSPASLEISNNKSLPFLMEHPTVVRIAKDHKKTPAQILLRYAVQNGIVVIPKSSKPERIKENHDIFNFELTDNEMKEINDMDIGEEGRFSLFLTYRGNLPTHPEYPWQDRFKKV